MSNHKTILLLVIQIMSIGNLDASQESQGHLDSLDRLIQQRSLPPRRLDTPCPESPTMSGPALPLSHPRLSSALDRLLLAESEHSYAVSSPLHQARNSRLDDLSSPPARSRDEHFHFSNSDDSSDSDSEVDEPIDDLFREAQQVIAQSRRLLQECKYDPAGQSSSSASASSSGTKLWKRSQYQSFAQREKRRASAHTIKRAFKRFKLVKSLDQHKHLIKHAAVINAINDKKPETLNYLIKEKKCPVDAHYNNQKAIVLAAHDDNIQCLEVLLHHNADPNYEDEEGNSLVYLTTRHDELCTRALINAGAYHTPVYHLARKVGENTGICITKYFKYLAVDNALILADRKKNRIKES